MRRSTKRREEPEEEGGARGGSRSEQEVAIPAVYSGDFNTWDL